MRIALPIWALVFATVLSGDAAAAAIRIAADAPAIPYRLDETSDFQVGCFLGCACPLVPQGPVRGVFALDRVGSGGGITTYRVSEVDWSYANPSGTVRVAGSGTYEVDASSGLQRMRLDLGFDGGAAKHFDSGLVPGGHDFPVIRIGLALHAYFCFDSAFKVVAQPGTAGVGPSAPRLSIRLSPNPSHESTEIWFSLPAAGPATLTIHDLSGRAVRRLATGAMLPAGPGSVTFDRIDDRGGRLRPGVYFVRLRTPGLEARAPLTLD